MGTSSRHQSLHDMQSRSACAGHCWGLQTSYAWVLVVVLADYNQVFCHLCPAPAPAVHDVPAGRISIDVSFAGTPIYEEVDDLCSKTSCPIKTGPLDIKYIQDLPPIAPPVSACVVLSTD